MLSLWPPFGFPFQVRRRSAEQFHLRDKLLRKLEDKASKQLMDLSELATAQKTDVEQLAQLQQQLAPILVKTRQHEEPGAVEDMGGIE